MDPLESQADPDQQQAAPPSGGQDAGAPPNASAGAGDAGAPEADTSGDFLPANAAPPPSPQPPGRSYMGGDASQKYRSQVPVNQDDTQVTPEEQKQYDDFVTRSLLFMNDPRQPKNSKGVTRTDAKAPRDVIIDHLNAVGGLSTEAALGRTTAQIASLIANNAQFHGQPYSPDVIFHGADEIISNLYNVGVAAGAIKNPPPAGSEDEQKLLAKAKMFAAKFYGDGMIASGQLTPQLRQQAYQYAQDQIKKEGDSGMLEHWNPGNRISNSSMIQAIQRMGQGQPLVAPTPHASSIADFAAKGHPPLVPMGGAPAAGGAPSPSPDQSGSAPDQSQQPPPQPQGGP